MNDAAAPRPASATMKHDDWSRIINMSRGQRSHDDFLASLIAQNGPDAEIVKTLEIATTVRLAVEANRPIGFSDMQLMKARQVLDFLIVVGEMNVARKFMLACMKHWDKAKFKANYHLLLDHNENGGVLEHIDNWDDFQIFDFGARTTAILFCGLTNKFGVPLNVMMQWLRKFPVNVVYFRDLRYSLYLDGIKSIGDLDMTMTTLTGRLADLGTQRLVCMGNSGGTFGALYYGHLLSADQVLCFSGPTSLGVGFQEAADRPVYERLGRRIDAGLLIEPDIAEYYRNNNVKARYFHGDSNIFDCHQAKHLSGIANVSVEPISNWKGHFTIGQLAERGLLTGILKNAFSG